MESKPDSFLREKLYIVLFCSFRTAYIVTDIVTKIYISRFILHGRNNIFKKFYVFDVVYVKSNSITC